MLGRIYSLSVRQRKIFSAVQLHSPKPRSGSRNPDFLVALQNEDSVVALEAVTEGYQYIIRAAT